MNGIYLLIVMITAPTSTQVYTIQTASEQECHIAGNDIKRAHESQYGALTFRCVRKGEV